MTTFLIALATFVGYILAYNTYGRYLARRVFRIDPQHPVPSRELRDDTDFVPTRRSVLFGHHFTSIAGTGPIVGPAIAVFWGWLPALLWVVFGSIFIGAVHDFGSLVVSMRNQGRSIGTIAGAMISSRTKLLFLFILALTLMIVVAVFGLVIANIFSFYPETVLPVWITMPLALAIGWWVNRHGHPLGLPSAAALAIVYVAVWVGVYYLPIDLATLLGIPQIGEWYSAVVVWTLVLLIYCFAASVLPVNLLLQPRDYINSLQLFLMLGLLMLGIAVASLSGRADLLVHAPAVTTNIPRDAPPLFPFLFITVACGAVSGFHSLVASGTSSKQIASEADAQTIGYGSMLLEGVLAVIVIFACCAGLGMGTFQRQIDDNGGVTYVQETDGDGRPLLGREAWLHRYDASQGWSSFSLRSKIGAFVDGGANLLASFGIPLRMGIGLIAVMVAGFAATTLDTATRLQRYVIQEIAVEMPGRWLKLDRYTATTLAVATAGGMALFIGQTPGAGGMILWPLFGAVNQLLAGLALLVIAFYLWKNRYPFWMVILPMCLMLVMPGWAMLWNLFHKDGWVDSRNWLLIGFGLAICLLQIWMMVEALMVALRLRRVGACDVSPGE